MVPSTKNLTKIRYPLDFNMKREDSTIPIIGRAELDQNNNPVMTGTGLVIVLDARMKRFLYVLQNKLESLELYGWLSLQTSAESNNKYWVFHVCNMKLIDALATALRTREVTY